MAIQFVGTAYAIKSFTTGANKSIALNTGLTGGIGSSVQAGDLVVVSNGLSGTSDATLTITDPSSVAYTIVGAELYSNDTFDANLRVAYKVMGGTPDASVNFSQSTGITDGGIGMVSVFRGVDTSSPMDVAGVTATGINSALVDPGQITPVTAGAIVVVAGIAAHGLGLPNFGLTGLTSIDNQAHNLTNDLTTAMGYTSWTSGALNPAAWTLTGSTTTHSWAAVTMALRPLGVGGNIKVWNGSAWTAKPVKFWNGSAWVTKPMKRWNGSAWITLPY